MTDEVDDLQHVLDGCVNDGAAVAVVWPRIAGSCGHCVHLRGGQVRVCAIFWYRHTLYFFRFFFY